MVRKLHAKVRMSNWKWLLIILVGWLYIFSPGEIEGYIFPAAKPMKLTSVKTSEDGKHSIFAGTSERLRPECSFLRVEWFLGRRGAQHVPATITTGPPKVRANGVFAFEGWTVDIVPPFVWEHLSYADVLHSCKAFTHKDIKGDIVGGLKLPWETRSKFWN